MGSLCPLCKQKMDFVYWFEHCFYHCYDDENDDENYGDGIFLFHNNDNIIIIAVVVVVVCLFFFCFLLFSLAKLEHLAPLNEKRDCIH